MSGSTLLSLLLLITLQLHLRNTAAAQGLQFDRDIVSFNSRPDIQAPVVTAQLVGDKDKLSDGYFFLAPWSEPGLDGGPHIYDNSGELVWSGAGSVAAENAHNLQTCTYQGSPHICFFNGLQRSNRAKGHAVIVDSAYRVVKTIETGNGRAPVDMHELNFQGQGKTAIVTYYDQTLWDLSVRHFYHSLGWALSSGFQEIDTATGEVLFDWDPLDFIDVSEGDAWDTDSAGRSRLHAWDFLHLNSVDKTVDGDYIISGRHSNTLYKISGVDGTILWRLGGANSTFQLDGFELGFQHHARIVGETPTATTVSLFNNGWDGRSRLIFEPSYGALIRIDHEKNVASLIRKYDTANSTLSASQGSMQIVAGGSNNVVVGWGSNAYVTEHAEDGTPLLNLTVASNATLMYRAFKSEWVGRPTSAPAIWTYAKDEASKLVCYVSWNGATEVASWKFYGGASKNSRNSFEYLGERDKAGFETQFDSSTFHAFAFAEAMSKDGQSLANSTVIRTFMPSSNMVRFCTDDACPISLVPASNTPLNASQNPLCHYYASLPDSVSAAASKNRMLSVSSLAHLVTVCLILFNAFQLYSYVQRRYRRYGGYRKVVLGRSST